MANQKTTDLTIAPSRALSVPAVPRRLAAQLASLVPITYGARGDDPGLTVAAAEPYFDPDAAALLPAYERACQPVSEATVRSWLLMINPGLQYPEDGKAIDLRLKTIMLACGSLPGAVWSVATAREASRTFDRWPSAARIYALLKPHADEAIRLREALRMIADPGMSGLNQAERSWLTYWRDKKSAGFPPIEGRPDVQDPQRHVESLVRQWSPKAWAVIERSQGPSRVPDRPTTNEARYGKSLAQGPQRSPEEQIAALER